MHTFIGLLSRRCATAAVAVVVASLLAFANQVSAGAAEKRDNAVAQLRCTQERDQKAVGYYDEQACKAQNAAKAADRDEAKYYDEQADRARKRAEALDLEAEKYYGERE